MRRLLPLLIAGLLAQGCAQNEDVSTEAAGVRLLVAERIHTSDPSRPEAGAMAWDADGRIVDVGTACAPTGPVPRWWTWAMPWWCRGSSTPTAT